MELYKTLAKKSGLGIWIQGENQDIKFQSIK